MGARDIEAYAILTGCRVPVTAHVGLAVSALGDYRVQGRGEDGDRIRRDSLTVPEAGAFAVIMEEVPEQLARRITEVVATNHRHRRLAGLRRQILVIDDMLACSATSGSNSSSATPNWERPLSPRSQPMAQE